MSARAVPVAGATLAVAATATLVVLRMDPWRARLLGRTLAVVGDTAGAEVMVVDLAPGAPLGEEARGFDGVLLVLSDNPVVVADTSIAGVLPRAATEAQVKAAVAAVAEGLTVRVPALREPPGFAAPEPARRLLTPREVEVLTAVGQGLSNKAMARRLGISAHTVKYHLESIYAKLDVGSRAEAVTRGLRLGLQVI